jgi:uncharacterized short protein YbdD (DUF466 family)
MERAVTSRKATQLPQALAVGDPGDREMAIDPGVGASRFAGVGRLLRSAWRYLRQASGDDKYERYVEHMALVHPGEPTVSRSEYFRMCQEQKWDGIKRCC